MYFNKISTAMGKTLKTLALCLGIYFFAGLIVFSYTPNATAQMSMSKDAKSLQAKGKTLNAKAKQRTKAAVERMQRILKDRRQGKRGFEKDFATIPGPNL